MLDMIEVCRSFAFLFGYLGSVYLSSGNGVIHPDLYLLQEMKRGSVTTPVRFLDEEPHTPLRIRLGYWG